MKVICAACQAHFALDQRVGNPIGERCPSCSALSAPGLPRLELPLAPQPAWQVMIGGKRVGPLRAADIDQHGSDGAIDLKTHVRKSGDQWHRAEHFSERCDTAAEETATRVFASQPCRDRHSDPKGLAWTDPDDFSTEPGAFWTDPGDFKTDVGGTRSGASELQTAVGHAAAAALAGYGHDGSLVAQEHTPKAGPPHAWTAVQSLPRRETALPPLELPLRTSLSALRARGARGTWPPPRKNTAIPLRLTPDTRLALPIDRATVRLRKAGSRPLSAESTNAARAPAGALQGGKDQASGLRDLAPMTSGYARAKSTGDSAPWPDVASPMKVPGKISIERKMLSALLVTLVVLILMHS